MDSVVKLQHYQTAVSALLSSKTLLKIKLALPLSLLAMGAFAAELPTAGSIMQQLEQQQVRNQAPPSLPEPAEELPELPPFDDENSVEIQRLEFDGAVSISTLKLQQAFSSYTNRKLDYPLMKRLAVEVGEFYRSEGLWAKVILPQQKLTDGVLKLRVYEGRLGQVLLEPNLVDGDELNFPAERIQKFITRDQSTSSTFRIDEFERSVRFLDAVPGITAAAILRQGEGPSETDVVVRAANTPLLSGSLKFDNNGSRSTGYNGSTLSLSFDGLLRVGDQLSLSSSRTEGVTVNTLGVSLPAGNDGSRLGINYTDMGYTVCCGPLASSGATGGSDSWALTHSKSLFEKAGLSLSESLTLNYKESESVGSVNRVASVVAGLDANWAGSLFGAAGANTVSAKFTRGELSIGDAGARASDAISAKSNGYYSKLSGTVSRLHPLSETDTLWFSLMGQWAFKNLDSSEKFSLGGSSSVRAYPGGEGSGDFGALLTVEWRKKLGAGLDGRLFYDQGWVRTNHTPWPPAGTKPNFFSLAGIGGGVTWVPWSGAQLAINFATRVGNNPIRDVEGMDTDGTRRAVRGWASFTQSF